jgi:hypothetical protein
LTRGVHLYDTFGPALETPCLDPGIRKNRAGPGV